MENNRPQEPSGGITASGKSPSLDKTVPIEAAPGSPEALQRLLAATKTLQCLAPGAPVAAARPEVRAIDFLRAADEIVRPFGFEITRLIGRGGMGAVFEGRDRKLDRGVAIKFILPERLETFDLMARLLESEARALASITHENAVQVYAIHRQGSNLFIVMELVRGASLAQYVGSRGPLPEAQALRLAVQTARALAALHAQGMIHRDIKPENILLSETGQAKLSDFGLATARQAMAAEGVMSSAAGTPAYMSPEIFEGGKPTVQSDIYSLGMTLRFMLTAKRAVTGDSVEEIKRAAIHGRYPGLRAERPTVSAETELVVAMALKRSADQRYQTADAFAAACEKALLQLGAVREKPATPPVRVVLRSGARLAALVVMVFVIGGLAGWWTRGAAWRARVGFRQWTQDASKGIVNLMLDRKEVPLVPAATAAASAPGVPVRVIGVVTATGVFDRKRNQHVVQDETGGVLIDDPDRAGLISASVAVGDKVEVIGIARLWQGIRVIEPSSDYSNLMGRTRPPNAIPLSLDQVSAEWTGYLVIVKGLQWAAGGKPAAAGRAKVTDGRGHEIELRAAADSPILTDRSQQQFDLVGVIFAETDAEKPGDAGRVFVFPVEIRPR
ncbi:serine/threonine protein kinase [Candidatus Sumerlaeota bacterium]|nr:serine/threonine protein kinase [Candidatus Sumerlaeota bacterium]